MNSRHLRAIIGSRRAISLSLLAAILLILCVIAGNWQYQRGLDRRAENALIRANFEQPPVQLPEIFDPDTRQYQGRQMLIRGKFLPEHEILLRNRYHEEQYGFGVTTLFQLDDGRAVWIDRGWVKAGASATEVPTTQDLPKSEVELLVRYRDDALQAKIQGSFFALPFGESGESQLRRWNSQASVESEPFYFDLIGGDFTPEVPTPAPLVSDGPHIAYAIQWWFFGALVIFGRFLIAREDAQDGKGHEKT